MTTFFRRRKAAGPSLIGRAAKKIWIWWVWTAAPAIRHPVETFKDWRNPNRHDEYLTTDDIRHLTPAERKELLG